MSSKFQVTLIQLIVPKIEQVHSNIFIQMTSKIHNIKGSMGPAEVRVNPPSEYLKKYEKTAPLKMSNVLSLFNLKTGDTKYERNSETKKPPVPSKDEKPLMGLMTKKDFVQENKKDASHASRLHNIV